MEDYFKNSTYHKIKSRFKEWIYSIFLESLKNLKVTKINSLLLHDSSSLLNRKDSDTIYKILDELKQSKLVKNIGFSVYNPSELTILIKRYNFDVVQAPFNIFDRRILKSGLSNILVRKKIDLHLRSIFLQGLLLAEQDLDKKFSKYEKNYQFFISGLKKIIFLT